jgi:hypothetical protein
MKQLIILFLVSYSVVSAQNLPDSWSQSYCTYDIGETIEVGAYSLGFGVNNYCIYRLDSLNYDERRFDLFAKIGILKNTEFEIKYSYPTSGLIAIKYQFLREITETAFKLGFSYMKGTRVNFITDYVYDFYPTLIVSKNLYKSIKFFIAPKIIYSIHTRDRQEHSEREPQHIFQYGFGLGFSIGKNFTLLPETNWLHGDNMGTEYIVNQFGLGVNLRIH